MVRKSPRRVNFFCKKWASLREKVYGFTYYGVKKCRVNQKKFTDEKKSVNYFKASPRLGPEPRKVTQTKKGNTKHNQTTTILFFTLLLTYGFLETIQIQTHEENVGQLNDTSPLKNHTGCHQFTYHSWTYHQGIHTFLLMNFYLSLMNYSNPPSDAKLNCFFFMFQH